MYKLMSATAGILLPAWVAAQETAPADQPAETVDLIYVAIFGLIFVGVVGGFFIKLLLNEGKSRKNAASEQTGPGRSKNPA